MMTETAGILSRSWRRKGGIISWILHVDRDAGASALSALVGVTVQIVRALDGFATPGLATWGTEGAGDEALEQDLSGAAEEVLQTTDLPDVTDLTIDLHLLYTDPLRGDIVLANAADLWIELCQDTPVISVRLVLDVDLYAWRSWGWDRDNRATAELNAPKLRAFLERLQRDLGAKVVDIDAQDYLEIDEFGFYPPRGEGV